MRLGLLFAAILLGLAFEISVPFQNTFFLGPDGKPERVDFFWLSDKTVFLVSFTYYFFEHIVQILISIYVSLVEPKYKSAIMLFVVLNIGDAIDFTATYNETYFFVNSFGFDNLPVTFNTIKVLTFMLAMTHEYFRNSSNAATS